MQEKQKIKKQNYTVFTWGFGCNHKKWI